MSNVDKKKPTDLKRAALAELEYVRPLGGDEDLILASANLGAYEAILHLLMAGEEGIPVYQLVTQTKSEFSSQAGLISRLRKMRRLGLIEERPGAKNHRFASPLPLRS